MGVINAKLAVGQHRHGGEFAPAGHIQADVCRGHDVDVGDAISRNRRAVLIAHEQSKDRRISRRLRLQPQQVGSNVVTGRLGRAAVIDAAIADGWNIPALADNA